MTQGCGQLEADEAAAHDQRVLEVRQPALQQEVVLEVAVVVDALDVGALHDQRARAAAGREQQFAVRGLGPAIVPHRVLARIDLDRLAP